MAEIMAQAKCYIKWETSNVRKKIRDVKEHASRGSDSSQKPLHLAYEGYNDFKAQWETHK